ncbi:hypothetical protein AFULGI_00016980 [Archaeoglobus fulgidus DSM 8774]|uniref:Uncharacterized protein n=1 Tax=Archaeoglobus fulgidus DSM 8774 TaxID=1344584 RepID=A0A075WF80_ARCFL|nr:hypothetical protein [Archaeoglobus fulgidus]AIG98457.1 hypothetical protein AFULGI_00016980 [Archaeoglobus fulgidus DSM 8774]
MAEVEDYTSGKILKDVKITLMALKLVELPIVGRCIGKALLKRMRTSNPFS